MFEEPEPTVCWDCLHQADWDDFKAEWDPDLGTLMECPNCGGPEFEMISDLSPELFAAKKVRSWVRLHPEQWCANQYHIRYYSVSTHLKDIEKWCVSGRFLYEYGCVRDGGVYLVENLPFKIEWEDIFHANDMGNPQLAADLLVQRMEEGVYCFRSVELVND